MLEKDIQRQILGYLKPICQAVGKTKTMGVYDARFKCRRKDPYLFIGFPDITGFFRNKLFFIEVKRPGEDQSLEQVLFQELCNKANITYILAHSVEEVQSIIA